MAVNRKLSQITLLAGTSLAMLASTGLAYGSGFELQEQSASGMGNAFAGGAAIAQDASTIYTNPAGMVRLPGWQTSVATSLICPSFKLLDDKSQSQPAAGQALGGTGGDAGSCAAVPALYLSVPASERLWAGVGVNAPFGLETDYHPDWLGRFQAIESKVETVNINPALAFRLNDHVALGFGISWQYIDAKLTSQVNYGGAVLQGVEQGVANGDIPPSAVPDLFASALGLESAAKIKGNDSTWGWNIGALITLNPETRIGLQYRSKIDYKVSGTASFNNPPLGPLPPLVEPYGDAVTSAINNGLLASGPVTLKLELPESANFSVVRDLDTRWQVMADVQYTGWSSVEALTIVRADSSVLINTPENFRDTWRYSLGGSFEVNDKWTLRSGVAFDKSPVRDTERTPRLPDNDRRWISFGAQYRYSPSLSLDAAYTHIYISTTHISQDAGDVEANGLVDGGYHSNANMFAVQLNYRFQ